MLHAWEHPKTGELRLYINGVPTEAWISAGPDTAMRGADWALWVRAGATVSAEKSPTKLAIESRLKAWLLTRFHRPLYTLRFQDLTKIAKGEIS